MENSGANGRRRLTHQVSVVDRFNPSNRRDNFRVKDDDDENNRESLAGLTLDAVLGSEGKRTVTIPPVSRTLFEIINDESGSKDLSDRNRKSWKSFRDRLRIRRASAAWASSSADGDTDNCALNISEPMPTTPYAGSSCSGDFTEYAAVSAANGPVMRRLAAALAVERRQRDPESERERSNSFPVVEEVSEEPEVNEQEAGEGAPVRMSLMDLLEETDREAGFLGLLTGDGAEEEGEEVDEDEDDDGGEYVCCVCMVRHKGAAFIPCGHTFCRLCSRELWVTRGNCPLCNGFISEILDIF
ncbi:hypothetical protein NE237_012777 [Protea cynaroides]|uniref:RING-type domain-containing protein n=1 Tax=Protea cynaroides TaxID=273540 RepID=A0A9Q0GYM2_9MAGN|nr:hypothetical protein NE237_012777 [Protea cynaroides]